MKVYVLMDYCCDKAWGCDNCGSSLVAIAVYADAEQARAAAIARRENGKIPRGPMGGEGEVFEFEMEMKP